MKKIFAILCMISLAGCKRVSTDMLICGDYNIWWVAISYDKDKKNPKITHCLNLSRSQNGWAYYYPIEEPSDTLDEDYDQYSHFMRITGKIWPVFGDSLICLYSNSKSFRFKIKYITNEELIVVDNNDNCIYFKADPSDVDYRNFYYQIGCGNCLYGENLY